MSVQPRRRKSGKTVYYAVFEHEGRTVWERSGTDAREAAALERQRRREVAEGCYSPEVRGNVTNAAWFNYFWTKRNNRALENDRGFVENHVLSLDWFATMPMASTRPAHILRVVEAMQAAGRLGHKSIALTYGVLRQAYARAVFEERIAANPCALPKGIIRWKSSKANAYKPYTRAEANALIYTPRIPFDQRVWNALALFTGMRMGEVCGRRWRDWKRDLQPLTGLEVASQYNDQPLKTDKDEDTHPRLVPVHPQLQLILEEWWRDGWEFAYGRKPELGDLICPHRLLGVHDKSSAYKAFQRGRKLTDVPNKAVHATRATFLSIARSGGARKDVIERITHNARGDIVDGYTEFEWLPLCEAVMAFDVNLDPIANRAVFRAPAPGLEAGVTRQKPGFEEENARNRTNAPEAEKTPVVGVTDARFDARQTHVAVLRAIESGDLEVAIRLLREKVTEGQ
jgi:integrase